ncbi:hypothetical protein RSSM_00527 [Rhodopirellula sallentina SM41]|uniref:Uncharacterized protein n=1 Tax=Rhodopirellula sallentina SM41 TaxID=1263870 RepID=M5UPS8_9BACT|nr:hypothetical protein RSSM_00527 [Rhodopirellula sallentina SM41]
MVFESNDAVLFSVCEREVCVSSELPLVPTVPLHVMEPNPIVATHVLFN